jgi:hypothetical protein
MGPRMRDFRLARRNGPIDRMPLAMTAFEIARVAYRVAEKLRLASFEVTFGA